MQGYDEYNSKVFREQYDDGTYICCNCGRLVPLENSYSSGGKHLLCQYCVTKIAKIINTDTYTIVKMLHNLKE